jgi:release factor glutamine methyltransferase
VVKASEALLAATRRIDRFDAELLLAHMVGENRLEMLAGADRDIDGDAFDALVTRRAGGEPVAYITGHREFWSLDLLVSPAVLIPRPDSETLVDAAIAARRGRAPATVLDLGTGSGALLLAGLSEWPNARGLGVDASAAALAVARANAERLGFARRAVFALGDWGKGLRERFDVIFCNPPYVETDAALSPEVMREPASALFAGADGLDDHRRIVPQLPGLLRSGGVALIEIGHTQAAAVLALAAAAGLEGIIRHDLAGRDRCLVLRMATVTIAAGA